MPNITNDKRDPMKLALGNKLREMKKKEPEKLQEVLAQMSDREAHEILYDPEIWLRESQWIDLANPAPTTLILSGRGFGKSFCGMATLMRAVEKHGVTDILLLARTARDIRSTLVPALMQFYPEDHNNKPKWSPATSEVIWPNGAKAICISAEAGVDSVRGLNTQLIIADECAFYGTQEEIVTMSYLTLRRPPSKMIALTSPYATPLIIDWVARAKEGDPNINLISGSTYENAENLSDAFMDSIINKFKGTSMERQELMGELVLENPSALFQMTTIDENSIRQHEVPQMKEVALGLDPSLMGRNLGSTKKSRTPDDAGLVVAGMGEDGYFYALDNFTGKYSVQGWVKKSIEIFDTWGALAPISIIIESNNLGEELMQDLYNKEGRSDVWRKVKTTFSTQNKMQRMQPFGLMAEQGKIKFVKKPSMDKLYTELTSYTGPSSGYSPGAFDAFAFAMHQLSPIKKTVTVSHELLF